MTDLEDCENMQNNDRMIAVVAMRFIVLSPQLRSRH